MKATKSASALLYGREYNLQSGSTGAGGAEADAGGSDCAAGKKSKTQANAKQGSPKQPCRTSPQSKQKQQQRGGAGSPRVDVIELKAPKQSGLPQVKTKQPAKAPRRARPTTAPALKPRREPSNLAQPTSQKQRRGLSDSTKALLQFDPEPVEALAQIALREKPELVPVSILAQINKEKAREKKRQQKAKNKAGAGAVARPQTAGGAESSSEQNDLAAADTADSSATSAKPKFSTISLNNSRRVFKQRLRDSLADGLVKMCQIHSKLLHEATKKEERLQHLCSQMEDLLVLAGDRNESCFIGVDAGIVQQRQVLLKAGKEISDKLKQVEQDHIAVQRQLRQMEDSHIEYKSELRAEEESVDQVISERKELEKLLAQLVDLNKRTHAKLTSKLSAFILRKEKIDAILQERRIQVGLNNEKVKMEEKISKGLEKWDNDLDNGVGVASPSKGDCFSSQDLRHQIDSVLSVDIDADMRATEVDTPHRPEPLHSPKFQAKLSEMVDANGLKSLPEGAHAFPLDGEKDPEKLEARRLALARKKRELESELVGQSALALLGQLLQVADTLAIPDAPDSNDDPFASIDHILASIQARPAQFCGDAIPSSDEGSKGHEETSNRQEASSGEMTKNVDADDNAETKTSPQEEGASEPQKEAKIEPQEEVDTTVDANEEDASCKSQEEAKIEPEEEADTTVDANEENASSCKSQEESKTEPQETSVEANENEAKVPCGSQEESKTESQEETDKTVDPDGQNSENGDPKSVSQHESAENSASVSPDSKACDVKECENEEAVAQSEATASEPEQAEDCKAPEEGKLGQESAETKDSAAEGKVCDKLEDPVAEAIAASVSTAQETVTELARAASSTVQDAISEALSRVSSTSSFAPAQSTR